MPKQFGTGLTSPQGRPEQTECRTVLDGSRHAMPSVMETKAKFTRTMALFSSNGNNNVVLEPSEDPTAFDSGKIGNARVHRYIESREQAEYVMWYHGRPKDFDSDLPPLSTGRIGRATSLNGLQWQKDTVGSDSEDVPGVSLGLNQESWWGFDTAHVGLGQVLLPMTTPAVLTEGGVYLMYFMGGSYDEADATKFVPNAPEKMKDMKVKGMTMKIGVALSQDGISFGRVEGDDPSGACMVPYNTDDPTLTPFLDDKFDVEEELYCAWPEVSVRIAPSSASPSSSSNADNASGAGLPLPGSKQVPNFFMFYSTMRKSDKAKCIGLAVSADGFQWYKRGICVSPDPDSDDESMDAGGCARCNVLQKADYNKDTREWTEKDGWIMFYEGVSHKDNKHRILLAESDDGKTWRKMGLALDVGASGETWDSEGVGAPSVIR